MAKNHKTIEELVSLCFDNLKNHNLTLDEFCQTFKIDKTFTEALIDPQNEILSSLSRFIYNSGYRITARRYDIPTHKHKFVGKYILIERLIEPKCYVNYDKAEQKFFRFRKKNNNSKMSMIDKQNYLHDFQEYLINHVL
jgi:hypothetical protein